jgi:hypothetical protein
VRPRERGKEVAAADAATFWCIWGGVALVAQECVQQDMIDLQGKGTGKELKSFIFTFPLPIKTFYPNLFGWLEKRQNNEAKATQKGWPKI